MPGPANAKLLFKNTILFQGGNIKSDINFFPSKKIQKMTLGYENYKDLHHIHHFDENNGCCLVACLSV